MYVFTYWNSNLIFTFCTFWRKTLKLKVGKLTCCLVLNCFKLLTAENTYQSKKTSPGVKKKPACRAQKQNRNKPQICGRVQKKILLH